MITEYKGLERRTEAHISDAQINAIAERAAEKAMEKLTNQAYQAIGKGVVSKFLFVVGVLATMAYMWASAKGLIK
jgi:uncharacterized membrane protein